MFTYFYFPKTCITFNFNNIFLTNYVNKSCESSLPYIYNEWAYIIMTLKVISLE